MHTLTVKISDQGTILHEGGTSTTGHMWYSLSENGVSVGSYGFAPIEKSSPRGPGRVHHDDDDNYASNYYTGEIVISKEQFDMLQEFGTISNLDGNEFDFSTFYNGLTNSCIDYTWKALFYAGINPSDFEGQLWPTWNADNADENLYKYLFGTTSGWDESLPDAGGYDVIYGSKGNDILKGNANTDAIYGGDGNDDIYGGNSNEKLYGGKGNDFIDGDLGNDYIYGGDGDDDLIGFDGNDDIYGGKGNDTIFGGDGNDTLIGGTASGVDDNTADTLQGGKGYDTYITGNGDTITDSDGKGRVFFNGSLLTGGKWDKDKQTYIGNEGTYDKTSNGYRFTNSNGQYVDIDTPNNSLGLHFKGAPDDDPLPDDNSDSDSTNNNNDEDFSSPLILDLNKDNTLTTRLFNSNTYFDMDGDGFKEKTAWVQQDDGLLVLDRNNNGTIDNGSELFGNFTPLGDGTAARDAFEALNQYDENGDGVIDKNDTIYNSLKVWKDNGDGITQQDELLTLKDAGVSSISLNPYQTLLSIYDENGDGVIDAKDSIYSKMVLKTDTDGTQSLYLPQTQNKYINRLLQSINGSETLSTNKGELHLSSIASSALQNIATDGSDTLKGTDANDKIVAKGGDDTLNGNDGDDILQGDGGDDILSGGRGNDYLEGGDGDDTYIFNRGDGVDVVDDIGGMDRVVFGSGINKENLVTAVFGDDLVVGVKEAGKGFNELTDKIVLKDWYKSANKIEALLGADGTSINIADIQTASELEQENRNTIHEGLTQTGTDGNDIFKITENTTTNIENYGNGDIVQINNQHQNDIRIIKGAGNANSTVITSKNDNYYFAVSEGRPWGNISSTYLNLYAIDRDTGSSTFLQRYNYGSSFFSTYDVFGSNQPYTKPYDRSEKWAGTDFSNNSDLMLYVFDGDEIDKDSAHISAAMNYSNGNTNRYDNFQQIIDLHFTTDVLAAVKNSGYYTEPLAVLQAYVGDPTIEFNSSINNVSSTTIDVFINPSFTKDDITIANNIGGEGLQTLSDAGISKIDLMSGYKQSLDNNNPVTYSSYYTDDEGNQYSADDVWFARNGTDTKYIYNGTIAEDIATLPNLRGYGRVVDLAFAMNEDASLAGSVAELSTEFSTKSLLELDTKVDTILAKWTGTENINPNQTRGEQHVLNHNYGSESPIDVYRVNAYARDVAQLEAFSGSTFSMENSSKETITDVLGTQLTEDFNQNIRHLHYATLIDIGAQALFGKDIYDDSVGELNRPLLFEKLNDALTSSDTVIKQGGANLLSALLYDEGMKPFEHIDTSLLLDASIDTILQNNDISLLIQNGKVSGTVGRYIYGTDTDDSYDFGSGSYGHARHTEDGKHIFAGAGNDNIVGTNSHDVIYGGDGDDIINGYSGDDIIYGGAGNDTLIANDGGSYYGFSVLDGGTGDDTLIGSGRQGKYIYAYGDGNDTIIDPGNVGTHPDILEFKGIIADDIKMDRDGNDMILTIKNIPADSFSDPSGSIRIKDGFGNGKMEKFIFEDGNYLFDELLHQHNADNTTYHYAKGDGHSDIYDILGNDKMIFDESVMPGDIITKVDDTGTLKIGIKENGKNFDELSDIITLKKQMQDSYGVESFEFADGTVMSTANLLLLQSGTDGDDFIKVISGDSIVDLKAGDDIFEGGTGNDTVTGGLGDDTLKGGSGNDTYIYATGDGKDTIFDSAGNDTLQFKDGITLSNIQIQKSANDIIVALSEDGKNFDELNDTVTIKNWYLKENRIEQFQFADGSIADLHAIQDLIPNKEGVYIGTDESETIIGDPDYNDILYAGGGDDTITGSSNSDLIYAEAGNDTIDGGGGDDNLYGGAGDDTYLFNQGDGKDIINDIGGFDTILFGEGINASDMHISRSGDDIVVDFGSSDTITISKWYTDENRIEQFKFSDGSLYNYNDLTSFMGNGNNNTVEGFEGDNTLNGKGGNDTLIGKDGNDTYIYAMGDGDDTIIDSSGTDSIIFGEGITPQDVVGEWIQGSDDIQITFKNTTDKLLLKSWYSQGNIESFKFADGTIWNQQDILASFKTDRDDVYKGLDNTDNILHSGSGDDILSSFGSGNDKLYGEDGNDALESYDGDDELHGGKGDDLLKGGNGNDTYIYNLNDGNDVIIDASGHDSIKFGEGITPSLLTFGLSKNSDDLTVNVNDQTITLKEWFNPYRRIENFNFADGQTLDATAILSLMQTENADTIKALDEGSTLDTKGGDDTIYGSDNSDIIEAGAGNDTIQAKAGNDIVDGGSGDDFLNGEAGDDSYIFARNSGNDTIHDDAKEHYQNYGYIQNSDGSQYWGLKDFERTINGGMDTLRFGDGITTNDIVVRVEDKDVVIALTQNGKTFDELDDKVRIQNFFETDHAIEKYAFSDGTILNNNQILDYLFTNEADTVSFSGDGDRNIHAKDGDDIVTFSGGNDIGYGDGGDDELRGGAKSDKLYGGDGNDSLYGGSGNDVLEGDKGDDLLSGGSGDDTYKFDRGDGRDQILETIGNDTLRFAAGISLDDLTIWSHDNDLTIALKEDGKSNDQLSDSITMKNWLSSNSVEKMMLFDGTVVDIGTFLKPTTQDMDITLDEDKTLSGNIAASGYGVLSYSFIENLNNGIFHLHTDGSYTYSPNENYNGTDSAIIRVSNAYGGSSDIAISINITPVNDAPIANEDSTTTKENTTLVFKADEILANDTDVDKNDTKSLVSITTPANKGSVVFDTTTDTITFRPNSDFDHLAQGASEEVLLTYIMEDKAGAQSFSVVKLTVTGTNDAPVIEDITPIATHEDDAVVTGNIVANDVDDNAAALYSTTATVAGFTLNEDGNYSFNPADKAYQSLAKDELQTITIPVTVTDDQGATDSKDFVIQITGTNDIPTVTVESESLLLQNIRNIDGKVEANDIDGDTLSYSVETQATHGAVTIDENGKWHYKAEGSFNGNDSAVVLVDDGNGGTVTQTLNFTVDGYIYEGEDLIIDEASGNDTLSMTHINKDELSFSRNSDDLQITVADGGTITLKNYFNDINAGVETLHTAQGDINLSRDVINNVQSHWWHGSFRAKDSQDHLINGSNSSNWLRGNEGNDVIFGSNRYDWLKGNEGDDLLVGGNSRDWLFGNEGDDNLYGDAGNDYLDGGSGDDALIGGSGRDRLYGDVGNDYLAGGDGNDRLDGDKGDDILIGGEGNDRLEGYYGSDTYIFNKGDGHDTIDEWSKKGSSDTDIIKFGEGITQDDVTILRDRYDAIFQIDADNSIRVKDWFDDDNRSVVEQIQFTDDTTLSSTDVNELAIIEGNNKNNRLYGMDKLNDNLFGLGGNDRLYGYEGDDFLNGGSGRDRLYGDKGNDTLVGGTGKDYLEGYYGSDTYIFSQGDGVDTIDEWSKKGSSDIDTIKFGKGITKEDISFSMHGDDLLLQYGENDLIKIKDASDIRGQVEKVELSNGVYVTNDDMELVIQQINAYGEDKGMGHIDNKDIQNTPDLINIVSSAWHE